MRNVILFVAMLLSLCTKAGDVKVEFITPTIVRVQWSADGSLPGNGTGACIYQKQKEISKSKELAVEVDRQDGTVTFTDRHTGKTLLKEQWRKSEPVVQERIIYDNATARMEETANGKVTVKDIIRRDTIGESTRYISHFSCPGAIDLFFLFQSYHKR